MKRSIPEDSISLGSIHSAPYQTNIAGVTNCCNSTSNATSSSHNNYPPCAFYNEAQLYSQLCREPFNQRLLNGAATVDELNEINQPLPPDPSHHPHHQHHNQQQQQQQQYCQQQGLSHHDSHHPHHLPSQQQQQQQQQQILLHNGTTHLQHHRFHPHEQQPSQNGILAQRQHQQQQQQQQQQHQLPPNTTSSSISVQQQQQISPENYDHSQLNHSSLPDSPPDSGSEPYSPQMTDTKQNIRGAIAQSMYVNHIGGPPSCSYPEPSKAPPAYMEGHSKMNGLLAQVPLPHVQHQQQHPSQRLPLPYGLVPPMPQGVHHQISPPLSHPILPAHMGSMTNINGYVNKKRKYEDNTPPGMLPGMGLPIKQEPAGSHYADYSLGDFSMRGDDDSCYDMDCMEGAQQVLKWTSFDHKERAGVLDKDLKDVQVTTFKVNADKGFNFSKPDEAFICQKKNHFQITVHLRLNGNGKFVKSRKIEAIDSFYLHFFGIKMESPNQNIRIEQSESDRSKRIFDPIKVDLQIDEECKKTVCRLHFGETTNNNMRKKCKPNPDQRYFQLVVGLYAHCADSDYLVIGNVSDRIIVRASNPGQFDNDVDVMWQKGPDPQTVFHKGNVGINTDHPDEALTVYGNLRVTGRTTEPSDMRVKENIEEINPKEQLENVSKFRLCKWTFKQEYASVAGIPPESRDEIGVLAQDLCVVLPEAVHEAGDVVLENGDVIKNLLVVDKDRVFMETVGATRALYNVAENLMGRIENLEELNKGLDSLNRTNSIRSIGNCSISMSLSSVSIMSGTLERSKRKVKADREGKKPSTGETPSATRTVKAKSTQEQGRNCDSPKTSGRGSDTNLISNNSSTSKFSTPFGKICSNRSFFIIIFVLAVIAIACLVVVTTIFVQKENSSKDNATSSKKTSVNKTVNKGTNFNHSIPISDNIPSSSRPPDHISSSTVTTTLSTTTERRFIPRTSHPDRPSIVPSYPRCEEDYCEPLCCPPPHEDDHDHQPIIVSTGDGTGVNPTYEIINSKHHGITDANFHITKNDDEDENVDLSKNMKTRTSGFTVDIPLGQGSKEKKEGLPTYNVVSNVNGPNTPYRSGFFFNNWKSLKGNKSGYEILNNKKNIPQVRNIRRRRGADDAPRPDIHIVEADNFAIGDEFCQTNLCRNNNYSYYIELSPSFGFKNITLQFSLNVTSYFALCSSTFMWVCPESDASNDIGGEEVQQTHVARWVVAIGANFRTHLKIKVIHNLTGKPVNNACDLTSNVDYVVMEYNFHFQRTCESSYT